MESMSHLDEGQLHAYLDGQADEVIGAPRQQVERHLAECPECRARLERERGVRDRARTILSSAEPSRLTVPPFDLVRERAARRAARRPRLRPTVALAWAASLGLALTVGWYARSLRLMRTGAAGEVAVTAETGGAEAERRANAIQAAPPPTRQLAQAAPERPTERKSVPARQPARPVETVAAEPIPAPGPERAVEAARLPVAAPAPAEPRAHIAVAAKARDTLAALRAAEAPSAAGVSAQAQVAGRASDEAMWTPVTPAEATERLDGPIASIPGLPTVATYARGTGQATEIRTIQQLGSGQTIELVQQRAIRRERRAAPAGMPSAAFRLRDEAVTSAMVEWQGFSVTARSALPIDSLRTLLGRLPQP